MKYLFSFSFLFITILINAQNIQDWRGIDRTGFYNEPNLLKEWPSEGPELLWSDTTIGAGYTSVLVNDEYAFVAGMIDTIGYIYCFNILGEKIWQSAYGNEWTDNYIGARSNLVLNGNALYFLSGYGKAFKMNAKNGEILWSVDLVKDYFGLTPYFGFSETALLVDDKVFFTPGGKHTMIALNQKDGSLVWKSPGDEKENSGHCSARFIQHNGRKVIIQQTKFRLWGFDFESGDSLWTYNIRNKYNDNSNPPYFFDGKILISSPYGNGTYLFQLSDDCSNINLIWKNELIDIQTGGFVVIDNHMYGVSISNKKWSCLDLSTGDLKWAKRGIRSGSIIHADDLIYIYTDMGEMVLVEPNQEDLKIISRFKAFTGKEFFAHPAIKNGKLYIRASNQLKVYAI